MNAYEISCRSMMTKDINRVRICLGLDKICFTLDDLEEDMFLLWHDHYMFGMSSDNVKAAVWDMIKHRHVVVHASQTSVD